MARRKGTQEGDVISRLADAGEDTVRALVDLPRRTAAGVIDRVEHRLREAAGRLRAIDPLYRRVVKIEKRLDSLESPTKPRTRRAPTRAKPPTARNARATGATQPEQANIDLGRRAEAGSVGDPKRRPAQAGDEGQPAA
jgi:hypothetical protein